MPTNPDRTNLCHFTYADGRRCTLPQFPDDHGLCYHHRGQQIAAQRSREAGRQVSRFLETDILTACDLSCTLSALFGATAQGFIKPRTARTLAYIAQLMLQAQQAAKQEYTDTFVKPWEDVVSDGPAFTQGDLDDDDVDPDAPEAEPTPATAPEPTPQNQPAEAADEPLTPNNTNDPEPSSAEEPSADDPSDPEAVPIDEAEVPATQSTHEEPVSPDEALASTARAHFRPANHLSSQHLQTHARNPL